MSEEELEENNLPNENNDEESHDFLNPDQIISLSGMYKD